MECFWILNNSHLHISTAFPCIGICRDLEKWCSVEQEQEKERPKGHLIEYLMLLLTNPWDTSTFGIVNCSNPSMEAA